MLSANVISAIEQNLGVSVTGVKTVGGGSINHTAKIETGKGNFFVKWNNASAFPGMFDAEEKGLHLLRECSGFIVPRVFEKGEADGISFLVMEYLDRAPVYWKDAGFILANMHQYKRWTDERFGLDHNNFIGSLKQSNRFHTTWAEFYATERILPQLQLGVDKKLLTKNDLTMAEKFCSRLNDLFPNEKPALLHGDLWNGNFMFTANGPAIFDPAVYWGHREMDLAMTRLFGGFDAQFYESYCEIFPLEKNWEQRTDYCNLYPLLVHVNLFGGGYVNDVRRILSLF